MAKLSVNAEKKYIESGGNHCPLCGSNMIEVYDQAPGEQGWHYDYVQCVDCKGSWTDKYSLFGVDIDDPEPPIEEIKDGDD